VRLAAILLAGRWRHEEYKSGHLSEDALRRMLEFGTRYQLDGFLKARNVRVAALAQVVHMGYRDGGQPLVLRLAEDLELAVQDVASAGSGWARPVPVTFCRNRRTTSFSRLPSFAYRCPFNGRDIYRLPVYDKM
jgi:hypothetical protein